MMTTKRTRTSLASVVSKKTKKNLRKLIKFEIEQSLSKQSGGDDDNFSRVELHEHGVAEAIDADENSSSVMEALEEVVSTATRALDIAESVGEVSSPAATEPMVLGAVIGEADSLEKVSTIMEPIAALSTDIAVEEAVSTVWSR